MTDEPTPSDPPRVHSRKTLREYFEAVLDGSKTFEVRDVDPAVGPMRAGDILVLREYDGDHPTGRVLTRRIGYVLVGPFMALIPEGVQVAGLGDAPKQTAAGASP